MSEHSILVVEDEHTLRRLLEYRLSKLYNVRSAANGEEALDLIEEDAPDLIISDIMMPRMDGFALQNAVQRQQDTRAIPFIFLTAKADEQSRVKGMRTGVDDYITKPFDIEQLLVRIERLLVRTKVFQTQLDAEIGKSFSSKLMPKSLPKVPNYKLFFHNKPREHGGGDLFDWMEAKPGSYFLTVGDVMGKGLQAKFYAFSFLGYVRSTIHGMLRTTHSPAEIMKRVNQVLMDDPPMEETFASLLLLRWEPEHHRVTYVNAGHCRPVLITPSGPEIIPYSDLVLGLDRGTDFKDTEIILPEESALVAYTDGLSEQILRTGEMAGEKGIAEAIEAAYGETEPIDTMLENLLERSATREFGDDILVLWLQRQRTEIDWFSPFAADFK